MLCPVWTVGESFGAINELANVRSLPGVGSLMNLQVLETRERFGASVELEWEEKQNFIKEILMMAPLTIVLIVFFT